MYDELSASCFSSESSSQEEKETGVPDPCPPKRDTMKEKKQSDEVLPIRLSPPAL
jgi:hypothetical protein